MAVKYVTGAELGRVLNVSKQLISKETKPNGKLYNCRAKSGVNKGKYNLEKSKQAYSDKQIVTRIAASKKSKATQKGEDKNSPDDEDSEENLGKLSLEEWSAKAKAGDLTAVEGQIVFNLARTMEAAEKALEQRLKTKEKAEELIDRRNAYIVTTTAGTVIKETFMNSIELIVSNAMKIEEAHEMEQMLIKSFKNTLRSVAVELRKIDEIHNK